MKRPKASKGNDRIGLMKLFRAFLDASSHLYKSVCPSVRRSVRRSVCDAFVKNAKIEDFMPF